MLFALYFLIVILLFDASIVNAECVRSFRQSPGHISVRSDEDYDLCQYYITAPHHFIITLNISSLHGFTELLPSAKCHTRSQLTISELDTVPSKGGGSKVETEPGQHEVVMRVLCHHQKDEDNIITSTEKRVDQNSIFYHSRSHRLKLTYVWLPRQSNSFNLHFYFRNNTSLLAPTPSSSGSIINIVIIVIAVFVALGFLTCIISHYKMGARSWSEQQRHHQSRHQHLSPPSSSTSDVTSSSSACHIQHSVNPVSTVLYMPPTNEGISANAENISESNMKLHNSLQHQLDANYPPSISLPDGEEIPYGSWKNFRMRTDDQQSEIYRECIKPPPNRTIFDTVSPQPYRSKSVVVLPAKKGGRTLPPTTPSTLVRQEDRLPLVMRCRSLTSPSGALASSRRTSSSSSTNSSRSVLVLPSKKCNQSPSSPPSLSSTSLHHQSSQQPSSSSTSCNDLIVTTPCSTGNHQAVIDRSIDPPPDYSEVVANPSIYHSTATNQRPHQNLL